MKSKKFDCVAMKRAGAALLNRKLRGMTIQQEVKFWRKESEKLHREQAAARLRKTEESERKVALRPRNRHLTVDENNSATTTATLFRIGDSQAVRLPKGFRFKAREVCIKRLGSGVLLFPKGKAWDIMGEAIGKVDKNFLADRDQPPRPERRHSL